MANQDPPALPERPRLRPIEAFMIDNPTPDPAAPKLLVLRDPSGLAGEQVTLPPLGAAVVELCTGERTRAEVCAEFQRRYRRPLPAASLDSLLARLDQAHLLDSEGFKSYAASIYSDFAKAEVRPAFFAGRGYPAEASALREGLERFFDREQSGPGLPPPDAWQAADAPPPPRAIIAPHVDMHRGGPAYAWAYRSLLTCRELPSLIVVLGTNHNSLDPVFTLTRKHFETPLGTMYTDWEMLEALLKDAKERSDKFPERLFADEHQHRGEHSLEFQMVWLRYVLQRRGVADEAAPKVLPVLVGSLQDYVTTTESPMSVGWPRSSFAPFLEVLRDNVKKRAEQGARVLWICAADLAHVGPRYGDRDPLSGADCDSLERRDRDTLRPVCAGDAEAWLAEIRRERDARRVCGLSPIYALLKAAEPPLTDGRLRCYAQCQAEAGSIVSIASVVYS